MQSFLLAQDTAFAILNFVLFLIVWLYFDSKLSAFVQKENFSTERAKDWGIYFVIFMSLVVSPIIRAITELLK